MSCSSSSSVSLLQLQRPMTRSRSTRRTPNGGVRKELAEVGGSCVAPIEPQASPMHDCSARCASPTPSSSSGIHYLNVDPTCSMSTDLAESEMASDSQSSFISLRSVAAGALGHALSRRKWQPDSESSLCSFKLCSTIFAPPSYFTLGPRRHHCRLCGLLYCNDHSLTRAPVSTTDKNGDVLIVRARVCDDCVERRGDVALSRTASTASSEPSEYLATPHSEYEDTPRRASIPDLVPEPSSPPVEPWMGRDAILSLYPLAANSSHSRTKLSPSAPPLFTPSRHDIRAAHDKEVERLTLRQRRMGRDTSFLLPQGDEESEEDLSGSEGILVCDGPICYRAKAGRYPARVLSKTDMRAMF